MLFQGVWKLKKHIFYHHTQNPTSENICDMCGKYFYDQFDVIKHIEKIHGTGRNILCPLCGDVFKLKHDLNKHCMKVHKSYAYEGGPVSCDICDRQFKGRCPSECTVLIIDYPWMNDWLG